MEFSDTTGSAETEAHRRVRARCRTHGVAQDLVTACVRSERVAQRELQLSRSSRAGDHAEVVAVVRSVRIARADAIRQVVRLGPEVEGVALAYAEVFLEREVPIVTPRRRDHESSG